MKIIKPMLLWGVVGFSVVGCAAGPGDKPADNPPRLVVANNLTLWDNVAAFGPVPESQKVAGQAVCGSLDTADAKYKATGYHPGAIGVDGQPFPDGGYFCIKE